MPSIFTNTFRKFLFVLSIWQLPIIAASFEEWKIPDDNNVKKWLDKTFLGRKYPKSKKEFMKMGFRNFTRPGSKGVLVFKHRGCRGYLFKLYSNKNGSIDELRVLKNRIKGAEAIRQYIKINGYQEFFKVPNKWLYQLEASSHFILVVEDMKILNRDKNWNKWKSDFVTEKFLTALASTLKELGLIDSMYIDNIPFCKDGKVAFIDTEHYHGDSPVRLELLTPRLPKKLQPFWESLKS